MHCQNVLQSRLYGARRFNILSAFNRTGIRVATTGGPINRRAATAPVRRVYFTFRGYIRPVFVRY